MKETTNKVVTVRKERPLPDVLEYSEGINVAEIAKKIHREPAEMNFVIVISLKEKLVVLLKESVLTNLSMMIS
jgi:hypothetical protein